MEKKDSMISMEKFIKQSNIKYNVFYQLQANIGDTYPIIKYIGQYDKHHVVPIFEFMHYDNIKCSLLSFLISNEDIENDNKLKMLCFLIINVKTKQTLGSLELIYDIEYTNTNDKLNQLKQISTLVGQFKITLTKNNITETIKILKEYPGRDESIYLLTNVLLEENVVEKII